MGIIMPIYLCRKIKEKGDTMYLLKTEHSFDSAHFLANHNGKCKNIHGHRWRVEVSIKSKDLIDNGESYGMVIDFSKFKRDVREIVDFYDHALIIEKDTMVKETYNNLVDDGFKIITVEFRPTAENLAKKFYDLVSARGYEVQEVMVYETPNNCAMYRAGE
ncbi:6-carboxytetrahydropterin synthase QueD [Dethiothermospora halolimnae]|uniref:6-carboxytetrahydropterin synthase QueD n=1 Tax=Dethiothermospora halolimnae TaxID=3114390 RepID=UPI003CCBD2E6